MKREGEGREKPTGTERKRAELTGTEPARTEPAREKPSGTEPAREKPTRAEAVREKPTGAERKREKQTRAEPTRGEPTREKRPGLDDARSAVREGGRLLLVTAVYGLLTVGASLALSAGFQALFRAWNLSTDTLSRAPAWACGLYVWHGSLITLLVDALVICFCMGVRREMPKTPRAGRIGAAWLAGAGLALASALLFLALDSLRLNWPLSRPRLSGALAALWLLNGLSAFTEELFNKHVLYEGVRRRWGAIPATVVATLAFFLFSGGLSGSVVSGVNVALLGALCCLLYRKGGLWASSAFRWGWGFASVFLLGQGGSAQAVYQLYGVSETWLTGGDAGLIYGLWLTAALAGLNAWLFIGQGLNCKKRG